MISKIKFLIILLFLVHMSKGILYADFSPQEQLIIDNVNDKVTTPFISVSGVTGIDKTFHPTNRNNNVVGLNYNSLTSPVDMTYSGYKKVEEHHYFSSPQLYLGSIFWERFAYHLRLGIRNLGGDLKYKYNDSLVFRVGFNRRTREFHLNLRENYGDDLGWGNDVRINHYLYDYRIGFYNFLTDPELLRKIGFFWGVDLDLNKCDTRIHEFVENPLVYPGTYAFCESKKRSKLFPRVIMGINWGILNYTYNWALGYTSHNIGLNFYMGKGK